jgi:NADPH-dependent 7-cyano-7-deazaguanine reductase QueF-like protein
MADPRGLQINKDIFTLESRIHLLSGKMPKTFRYSTLHQKLVEHVIEMRHYTNLACRVPKWNKAEKVTLFGVASGFALDVADDLEHEYNLRWLTDKGKAQLEKAMSHLNAYLGLLKHSRSFNLRKKVIDDPRDKVEQAALRPAGLPLGGCQAGEDKAGLHHPQE